MEKFKQGMQSSMSSVVLSKIITDELPKEARFTGALRKIHNLVTVSKMLHCVVGKLRCCGKLQLFCSRVKGLPRFGTIGLTCWDTEDSTLLFLLRSPWQKGLVQICKSTCLWPSVCTVRLAASLLWMHLRSSNYKVWFDLNIPVLYAETSWAILMLLWFALMLFKESVNSCRKIKDCMSGQPQKRCICRILKSKENLKISCQRSF